MSQIAAQDSHAIEDKKARKRAYMRVYMKQYHQRNKTRIRKIKQAYAKANQEKIREYQAAYRKAHREELQAYHRDRFANMSAAERQEYLEYHRTYYRKHKNKISVRHREWWRMNGRAVELKQHYDLTLEQYDEILRTQDGVCAICKRPEPHRYKGKPRPLHVDHDHKTQKRRGLLCSGCNHVLGHAGDDAEILRRAADYLEWWQAVHEEGRVMTRGT